MADERTPEQIAETERVAVEAKTAADAEAVKVAEKTADEAAGGEHEDKEPGGVDPQAVRARKEYRQRKRYEVELRQEREARIAAEAREGALKEQAAQPAKGAPHRYTVQEVQTAIDAGNISAIEGADYLAKQRAEEVATRVLGEERARVANDNRYNLALGQVQQYAELAPWITDKADSRYAQLDRSYRMLTDPNGLYQLPQSPATDLLVLEQVLGPIEKLRKKGEVVNRGDFHAEAGAGGGGGTVKSANGAGDFSKAPKNLVDFWDRTGTSSKDREAELKIWTARELRRKSA